MNRSLNLVKTFNRLLIQNYRQYGQVNGGHVLASAQKFAHFQFNINPSSKRYFSSNSEEIEKNFQTALAQSQQISGELDNDKKLKMYALFKQGTIGPCTGEKPSMFNPAEKAKWQAWQSLGEMQQDEAKKEYINLINDLLKANPSAPSEPDLVFEERDQVYWIKLNRPKKFNAITPEMYNGIVDALKRSAEDPGIKLTVITGNGQFYSSGNDLQNFTKAIEVHGGDMEKALQSSRDQCQQFVSAFIDFPKPLIGVVNGPCIGIMFTTLGLADCVIAADDAYFYAPFSSLGQAPEGCSTITFPQIFGPSLASKILYFSYKMPVEEAHRAGFVSEIVKKDQLSSYVEELIYGKKGIVKNCYTNSMINAKATVRNEDTKLKLHEVNKIECDVLMESWKSEECQEALQKFYTRK